MDKLDRVGEAGSRIPVQLVGSILAFDQVVLGKNVNQARLDFQLGKPHSNAVSGALSKGQECVWAPLCPNRVNEML